MLRIALTLWQDDNGFVVSSELALVGTIAVLGMGVGLSEAAGNTRNELRDVGGAVGSLDQSFSYTTGDGQMVSYVDRDHQ